ncbi:galacturonokinase [Sarracenia purpurea var. burkii]
MWVSSRTPSTKESKHGIIGFLCGSDDLHSSGLSSSAAVGVAYLLAFESANNLVVSPTDNIEYDRLIENEYLGLKNGILDQSAILLSSYGCLTCMNCKCRRSPPLESPPSASTIVAAPTTATIIAVLSLSHRPSPLLPSLHDSYVYLSRALRPLPSSPTSLLAFVVFGRYHHLQPLLVPLLETLLPPLEMQRIRQRQ